jgi:hypothetical protein
MICAYVISYAVSNGATNLQGDVVPLLNPPGNGKTGSCRKRLPVVSFGAEYVIKPANNNHSPAIPKTILWIAFLLFIAFVLFVVSQH